MQYELIVDADGVTCQLEGRTARVLDQISSVKGNKWVLTDFGGLPPRFMTVDAPACHAEIVALRRLQEKGEAGEDARICTHWKRARGKTSTELFFTLAEKDYFRVCEDRALEDSDHHLLFSVYALMYASLRTHSDKKNCVVMFEHDRHVDLLMGRSGQVLASARVSSYANTSEAKENQVETVGQELQTMMAGKLEKLEKIVYFSWLSGEDNEDKSPEWGRNLAIMFNAQFEPLGSSIQDVMKSLTVADSSSSTLDSVQYLTEAFIPKILVVSLMIVAALLFGAFWLQWQTSRLNAEVKKQLNYASSMKVEPVDPVYKKTVAFVNQVGHLQNAPSLHTLLADISAATNGRVGFDQVIIEYDELSKATVILKGRIPSGFDQASQDQEAFIRALQDRAYSVINREFFSDVTELKFTITLGVDHARKN
ncbi:MAG: hypothetical protein HQL94_01735 [Magnetococcales bacterium]|nr:hypothetical protein [Magnetococcales bacterium]MBF0438665.1 hypothetical protein [Magnetococcales bacterium]